MLKHNRKLNPFAFVFISLAFAFVYIGQICAFGVSFIGKYHDIAKFFSMIASRYNLMTNLTVCVYCQQNNEKQK